MEKRRIAVIGAGNVAWHLAPALSETHIVTQVMSRSRANAEALASRISGCEAITSLSQLQDNDIYLISAKDDAIGEIVNAVGENHCAGLWIHTSGSVDKEVFSGKISRYGVFYPLQTFSKASALNMREVPIFIEGSNEATTEEIRRLAQDISDCVYYADSNIRRQMHIAAVFACNYTNYLYTLADEVLAESDIPFSVLRPLLDETLRKAVANGPAKSQTGPASRGDKGIIETHLSMLSDDKKEVYQLLSEKIFNRYNL